MNRHANTPKAEPRLAPARGQDRRAVARGGADRRGANRVVEFCGAMFDAMSPLQTLERCGQITTDHEFRYIVTPNVDHIVRLDQDPATYKPLYDGAWLSVCDSRILQLLAKKSGLELHAVPGSDLTEQLFDHEIDKDEAVTIIGADKDIVSKLKARYGLNNIHHHQPPMGLRHKADAIAACAAFIKARPARFHFLCVGSPQQEMIAIATQRLGGAVGLGLCVGASLDFLAGHQKRAPKWMQKARLEWLYRLLSNPKRMWKRYLVEGPKIFRIWQKWKKHNQAAT